MSSRRERVEECSHGVIHNGIVDDWRTTDEAGIETHAEHFHASPDIANKNEESFSKTVFATKDVSGAG